jgi:hypothetical protein
LLPPQKTAEIDRVDPSYRILEPLGVFDVSLDLRRPLRGDVKGPVDAVDKDRQLIAAMEMDPIRAATVRFAA